MSPVRPRIGLALGGGAARGWAHIGVIEALAEAGIHPEVVAGTSMGALVGAVFAGNKLDELKAAALRLDWKEIVHRFATLGMHRSGLVDGGRLLDFIRPHLATTTIQGLPRPYACVATDLASGKAVLLREGDLLHAVRCSISIPGLLTPVAHEGRVLVDGGVTNPVPVDAARLLGADFIIAVDINHGRLEPVAPHPPGAEAPSGPEAGQGSRTWRSTAFLNKFARQIEETWGPVRRRWAGKTPKARALPSIFDVLGNSLMTMEAQITELNLLLHRPDVLIRPAVGGFRIMDFDKAAEIMELGRQAGQAALPGLLKALGRTIHP